MKFSFTCKKISLNDSVKAYAEKKIGKLEKYFKEEPEATVTFAVEKKNRCIVEVMLRGANGTLFRAVCEDADGDMRGAIDEAVSQIDRKIRKNKTRLAKNLRSDAIVPEVPEEFDIHEEREFDIVRTKRFAVYLYNQVTALYTGLGGRVHRLSVHLHIPGTHHQHPVCIDLNSEGTAADRHLPRRRFLQRHSLYRHRVQQAHLFLRPGDGRLLPGVHRSGTPAADGIQAAKVSCISAAGTHCVRQSPTAKANQAVDHRKHHGQYCRNCTHTLFHFITRFSMR